MKKLHEMLLTIENIGTEKEHKIRGLVIIQIVHTRRIVAYRCIVIAFVWNYNVSFKYSLISTKMVEIVIFHTTSTRFSHARS